MDRTFAEVRAAFDVWARADGALGGDGPPAAAYDAVRDTARRVARQGLLDMRAWASGELAEEALAARLTALVTRAAAAAWWQGAAAARDGEDL